MKQPYRGQSVEALERMKIYALVRAVDDDWLIRDRGRDDVAAIDKALTAARKRDKKKKEEVQNE